MNFALVQIDPIIGDVKGNYELATQALQAIEGKADIAIFPEMALLGYPPKDLLERPEFIEEIEESVKLLLPKTNKVAVIMGTTRKNRGAGKSLYNSALFIYKGKIIHSYNKMLLPYYDVFDETRYFEAGKKLSVFKFKGVKLALTICEDIWTETGSDIYNGNYLINPLSLIKPGDIDFLINISASPFGKLKFDRKIKLFSKLTRNLRTTLIYVNTVGANDEIVFDGRSFVISNGKPVEIYPAFEKGIFIYNDKLRKTASLEYDKIEDIFNALKLGLSDYCAKTGFKKVVIGLSGGIDSAVTAAIAIDALGKENVNVVMMPSSFTSSSSLDDAKQFAANFGLKLNNLPITSVFEECIKTLRPMFNDKRADVTEENLQARIRGVFLMALSNKFRWLLLSAGNKSEIAVGYTTLYGDLTGGLALISDLYKTEVYEIARYINRKKELIPANIIKKAPTAELAVNQKDSDSLPDYAILDRILELYLEELKTPDEILKFGFGYAIVRKVIGMIDKNEYKRRQAPPGIKISLKAFGYGRRYPIAKRHQAFLNR